MRYLTIIALVAMSSAIARAEPSTPTPDAMLAEARTKIAAAMAMRAGAQTPEEKAVVDADLAFAADAKKRGAAAAFASVAHPDIKMFPPRQAVVMGVDAVKALFKDDSALWEWAPVQVLAEDGLGATWGIAAISGKGEDGKPFTVTTRYVTVWRKDAGGAWKLWLDLGTPGPLPDVK